MTWFDAVPWNKLIKKVWGILAFDKEGRSRERAIIVVGALFLTLFLYIWAIDTFDPSRNLSWMAWQWLTKPDHTIASGKEGGWYFTLAHEIKERMNEGGKFGVKVDPVGGSGSILKKVVSGSRTIGILQEDVLSSVSSNGRSIRVIAPLYNERLHVVYRWSKLQEIASSGSGHCAELQNLPESPCSAEVILAENPDCLTRELVSNSTVRLGSGDPPVGRQNTPQRVLAMAGLQPNEGKFGLSIDETIQRLIERTVDVAFIISGAPVPALETELREGSDSDLCLAAVDGRFTRLLNDVYGTDYRFSGFSRIYPDRFNRVATFEVSAVLVANPRVPRSFIGSVTEALHSKKKEVPEDQYYPLEDFGQIDTLGSEPPSLRFEILQASVIFGLFCIVVWSSLIAVATWTVSSFKEAMYTRRLQHVYEQLPSHVVLEKQSNGIPIPELAGDSEEVVSRIVSGIADLLQLAMDIRKDNETGGITSSHYNLLIGGVYRVKDIFTRHLAQRLHNMIETDTGAVSLDLIARYYNAGYLLRDDFRFLRGLFPPAPGGSM